MSDKETTSTRLMPKRDFYGSAHNTMLGLMVLPIGIEMRPLAKGERRLGNYIVPPFQRRLVWTLQQKVRLIESIYMGLPIGALIYNQTSFGHETDGWLLDGQQRLSTILAYVNGEFPVMGWRYPDLPDIERRHFEHISLSVLECSIREVDRCRDLYDRLAYGGTAHV